MTTRKEVYEKIMELQRELYSHQEVQDSYKIRKNYYPNISAGDDLYDRAKVSRAEIRRIQKECNSLAKVMVSLPLEATKPMTNKRLKELKAKSQYKTN